MDNKIMEQLSWALPIFAQLRGPTWHGFPSFFYPTFGAEKLVDGFDSLKAINWGSSQLTIIENKPNKTTKPQTIIQYVITHSIPVLQPFDSTSTII
jgi:hypothetical protein